MNVGGGGGGGDSRPERSVLTTSASDIAPRMDSGMWDPFHPNPDMRIGRKGLVFNQDEMKNTMWTNDSWSAS